MGNDIWQTDDQNAALNQTIVALCNAFVQQKQAESLPAKDLFGNYRPRKQYAKLQTEDRNNGYQPVFQYVLEDDRSFSQPFGPCCSNIILTQLPQ